MTEVETVDAGTLSRALLVIENDQMLDPALPSIPVIVLVGAGDLPESADLLDNVEQKCKRRSKSAAAGRAKSESPEVVFLLIGRARLPR